MEYEVMEFVRNQVAAIRKELMAKRGASAGELVAIDTLNVAQQAIDPAEALQSVQDSLRYVRGLSGTDYLSARLDLMRARLETLIHK